MQERKLKPLTDNPVRYYKQGRQYDVINVKNTNQRLCQNERLERESSHSSGWDSFGEDEPSPKNNQSNPN